MPEWLRGFMEFFAVLSFIAAATWGLALAISMGVLSPIVNVL